MRTKSLLMAVALGAAGVVTSMAQTVYSVNVVGYTTLTLTPNSFALFGNQLNSTNNSIGSLLSTVPPGTAFYKYNGTGFTTYLYDEVDENVFAWTPNGNATLNPGEGGFIKNPASTNVTLVFVGEVITGSTTNGLSAGFQILSSKLPVTGTAVTLGIPAQPGDAIYKYNGTGYNTFLYDEVDENVFAWTPSAPSFAVNEAFWLKRTAGGSWTQSYTVQ